MTKNDFISVIALAGEISKKQAACVLASLTTSMRVAMLANKRVVLPSIGSLSVTDRPAREGRNPRTGAKLQIAAGKKITFKAAKELKEAV